MTRIQISKKLRFEVFKRDGFVCQYCGSHPPKVVLHVDHIVAVAEGGGNNSDNLVTSCQPCNLGKGARSLKSIPQSLQDKAADISEKEAQLRGYHEIIESKRNRIEEECWRVADNLQPGSSDKGFNRADLQSIKRFVEQIGVHETLDASANCLGKRLVYNQKNVCLFLRCLLGKNKRSRGGKWRELEI